MRAFDYTAFSESGKRKSGSIIAETEAHAAELLTAKGLFASEISVRGQATGGSTGSILFSRNRLNADLQAVFTRQMAVLLSADLPTDAALEAVRTSGTGGPTEAFATSAKAALLEGAPLSEALHSSGASFAPYYIAAVRAGETSGDVGTVFGELANHLEDLRADRAKISTALIYPAFVAAVSLLVCAILMVNVAPEIVSMFEGSGQPLPQLTQRVLAVSNWIGRNATVLALGATGGVAAFLLGLRHAGFRDGCDRLVLRLPVIGRLKRLDAAAQYLRTLALVIASRQAVVEAVVSARDVLMVRRFREEAEAVTEGVRSGEKLSEALKRLSIIPPVAMQLVSAGEASARLARMTERAAVLVENGQSVERKRIAALLEPILMMLVGGFVLVIVLAVLLPIFDLQAVVTQ